MHKLLIAAAALSFVATAVAFAQDNQGGGGRFAQMFAMADANHDGTITRAEFDAARAARFTQMDADHNGTLSAAEMPQRSAQPAGGQLRGDANGDGSVSRAEWDADGARMFSRLDANNDGSISQAELQAAQQRMQH